MSATTTTDPKPAPPPVEKIKIKVDGREIEAPKTMPDWQGKHHATTPHAPGPPRPPPACPPPTPPGMEIYPGSPATKQMREAVLESLLINHPLDCPICDQAGECKLQEYSVDYG